MGNNVVSFSGNIVASPGAASDCAFPAAVTQIAFGSGGNILANSSSLNAKALATAVYVPLDGIGVGETVTQGTFLYARTNTPMTLRYTTQGAPDLVAEVPIYGTVILQFPQANYLKLLEAKGTGSIEYLVAGNA